MTNKEGGMIDLSKFTSSPDGTGGHYLSTPWSVGDHSVATNGHILVRVPRRDDIPENDKAPSLETVLASAFPSDDFIPFPAFTPAPAEPCNDCRGIGRVTECEDCDGEGEHECLECGNETECASCQGSGVHPDRLGDAEAIKCAACAGSGHRDDKCSVTLADNLHISQRYALLIADLPAARIVSVPRDPKDLRAVPFVFDGGDGLVMPLSRPYSEPHAVDLTKQPAEELAS